MGKFHNIQYTHRYSLNDKEIEHVFEEKDLGVIIDMNLSFEEHMASKIKKANGTNEANNINTFKSRLDHAWFDHPTKHSIDITNDQDRFEEAS